MKKNFTTHPRLDPIYTLIGLGIALVLFIGFMVYAGYRVGFKNLIVHTKEKPTKK